AHARRLAEQRSAVAAAGPVWDQVAGRLGFRSSRDRAGYPAIAGTLDDVPCTLRLADVRGGTSARVYAHARARVMPPWHVVVRASGSPLLRWIAAGRDVLVGDLTFDRAFAVRALPR